MSPYRPQWDGDDDRESVACDRCGKPTIRLEPPAAIELCDYCYEQEQQQQNRAKRAPEQERMR